MVRYEGLINGHFPLKVSIRAAPVQAQGGEGGKKAHVYYCPQGKMRLREEIYREQVSFMGGTESENRWRETE